MLLLLIVPAGGCRLTANCDDLDYPAYGGAWERTRRDGGRVGSVFDPAGGRASALTSRDEPERPDAQERNRQAEKGDIIISPDEDDAEKAEPDDSDMESELEDKTEGLRDRKLDDIPEDQKLRKRRLDEIDVKVIPGQPLPPLLR
jgi:hypothetical protein